MRRFIKTFTVRRHLQFSVIQDGEARTYAIYRWAADSPYPILIDTFTYPANDPDGSAYARDQAIHVAKSLYEAEYRSVKA